MFSYVRELSLIMYEAHVHISVNIDFYQLEQTLWLSLQGQMTGEK